MSTYVKITDFASKDTLLSGNPAKIVKGSEIGAEFDALTTADASNVKGPVSTVTDNAVVRWDTTTGRIVQGSGVTVSDADIVTASGFSGPHNGTVGATTPSTGAFTTLSATAATLSDTSAAAGAVTAASYKNTTADGFVRTSFYNSSNAIKGTIAYYNPSHATRAGQFWLRTEDSGSVYIGVNDAAVGTFSSTGLAVTGTVSATGAGSIGTATPVSASVLTLQESASLSGALALKNRNSTQTWTISVDSQAVDDRILSFVDTTGGTGSLLNLTQSGNLGLGVTPSASARPSLQLGSIGNGLASRSASITGLTQNCYYNAGFKYSSSSTPTGAFELDSGAFYWYTAASGTAGNAITFTQAMTLDASGNLQTAGYVQSGTYTKALSYLWAAGTGTAGGVYLGAGLANGLIAQASGGTGTTTTYIGNQAITTSSDERLKDNIVPTQRNATELLMQWDIIDHTWNDPSDQSENNRNSRGVWTGIRAQQVQPITPWLVNKPVVDTNDDGSINPWTMDFGYAVPLVVKMNQEQQAEIETLKAKVAQLEADKAQLLLVLASVDDRLAALEAK